MATGFTMKVTFLKTSVVKDENGMVVETFEEGKEYELKAPSARRWIRRNLAVEVEEKVEKPKVEPPPKPKPEPEPVSEEQIDMDLGLGPEPVEEAKPSKPSGFRRRK